MNSKIYTHTKVHNNIVYSCQDMAESEEEQKSLLMKAKEESEKVGFKAQHSEN